MPTLDEIDKALNSMKNGDEKNENVSMTENNEDFGINTNDEKTVK